MSTSEETLRRAAEAGDSHFIQAGGLRFHYLTWGDPGNPPLLLLHGGGQTAHTWQRVANRLRDRYHVIAPDARGHGDSEWSPDGVYDPFGMHEDVAALVGALGLRDFVLGGMSMGGFAALGYAAEHGANLRGLMVVDISPALEEAGTARIGAFLRAKQEFDSLDEVVAHAHAYNPLRSPERLRETLPANLRRLPNGKLAWKWDPAFIGRDGSRAPGTRPRLDGLWEKAARIPCPTLVVHGRESDVVKRENGERLARSIPNARFVSIAGAGHSVQGDNPHSLSEALEQFLREIGY